MSNESKQKKVVEWLRVVWWVDDGTLPSMKKLGAWVRLVALSVWWWVTGPYWLVRIWREACREEEQNRRAYEADGWKFEE